MNFDAAIIGAGPAGAVTAYELARRGHPVFLVDKAKFPRPKVCGCCLNRSAVQTLHRLGLGAVLASAVPLTAVCLAAARHQATISLSGGVALSRERLDAALVEAAVRAGAIFQEGEARQVADCQTIARVVVVASGLLGNAATPCVDSRIGAGVVVAADMVPAFFRRGIIYMATAGGGYVGLVRLEDDRLDVAAAFDAPFVRQMGGLGLAAEAILAETRWPAIPQLARLPWKGTPALTRRATRRAGPRWFAVGDAAGYVEPFTGEGIAWAIRSATALAPLVTKAAERWSDSLVRQWEVTHRRRIQSRQRVCRIVTRALRWPLLTAWAVRTLAICPALARPLVASLNRCPQLRGAEQ
ncbi:MAG: NAD(P)/FAD-dependent oxidoreductase [Gemmataceae bacterium]|nr:NAD(P)/FAD-dependent oxidoreductase [Gemmata sp.]MDW8197785.1 NAD(P)/FAD-dependent oxidoreductase [Gemmataceae bacterium]